MYPSSTTPIARRDNNVAAVDGEYVVQGAESALHGVTLDSRRVVVGSGSYLLRLVPGSGRLIERLETFPGQGGLAYDGRCLWQQSRGRLEQLEVRTGFVVRSAALDFDDVAGLECIDDGVLVLHAGGRSLARVAIIDHVRWVEARIVAESRTGAPLRGLVWVGRELWSSAGGQLVCIDPISARARAHLALPDGVEVCDLAADAEGRLWCVDGKSRTVRILSRPGSGTISRTDAPEALRPTDDAGHVWPAPSSRRAPRPSDESPASGAASIFKRILVAVDFSEASRRALATALLLQERMGSEVRLFHLADQGGNDEFIAGMGGSGVSPNELVDDARARLLRFVDNVFPGRAGGVEVLAHVGTDVVRGVERAAREGGATLVLLGGRPRSSLFHADVEKVARDLGVAVMVTGAER